MAILLNLLFNVQSHKNGMYFPVKGREPFAMGH